MQGRVDCNTDVDDADTTSPRASGLEQQPGLARREAHRLVGAHGESRDDAGCTVDAGRNVDREHADACSPELARSRGSITLQLATKTGPEHRIDREVGPPDRSCERTGVNSIAQSE